MNRKDFLKLSASAMAAAALSAFPTPATAKTNHALVDEPTLYSGNLLRRYTREGEEYSEKVRVNMLLHEDRLKASQAYAGESLELSILHFNSNRVEYQTRIFYSVESISWRENEWSIHASYEKSSPHPEWGGKPLRLDDINGNDPLTSFLGDILLSRLRSFASSDVDVYEIVGTKNREDFSTNRVVGLEVQSASTAPDDSEVEVEEECFLTTACTDAVGLPDDCHELTTLRAFRDKYMRRIEDGRQLIEEYYDDGPAVVRAISAQEQSGEVYSYIYKTLVTPAIALIEADKYTEAMRFYEAYVRGMKSIYGLN